MKYWDRTLGVIQGLNRHRETVRPSPLESRLLASRAMNRRHDSLGEVTTADRAGCSHKPSVVTAAANGIHHISHPTLTFCPRRRSRQTSEVRKTRKLGQARCVASHTMVGKPSHSSSSPSVSPSPSARARPRSVVKYLLADGGRLDEGSHGIFSPVDSPQSVLPRRPPVPVCAHGQAPDARDHVAHAARGGGDHRGAVGWPGEGAAVLVVVARAPSNGGACGWGGRREGAEEDRVGPVKQHVNLVRTFEFNHPGERCQALKQGGETIMRALSWE